MKFQKCEGRKKKNYSVSDLILKVCWYDCTKIYIVILSYSFIDTYKDI